LQWFPEVEHSDGEADGRDFVLRAYPVRSLYRT